MNTKNSFSVKQMNKDLKILSKETQEVVQTIVSRTAESLSNKKRPLLSFDDTSAITPYNLSTAVRSKNSLSIVASSTTVDPFELDDIVSLASLEASYELKELLQEKMKEVLH